MEGAMEAAAFAAQSEAIVFLSYFEDFADPRQRGKVVYPLNEILLLCLLAVLAGAETFVDIARFGRKKIALLRRFLPFQDGTPSHDHRGDIFATLDATEFQRRFVAWVAKLIGVSADVIASDGKTLRGSAHKKRGKAAIPMVSAFAARQRLVLGHVKVADKSNEIVAIRCVRMSSCSLPSRRPMAFATPRSPTIRPSTAITAASKPEPIRRSTM